MHELSLAEDMLDLIIEQARLESFEHVDKVVLEVGCLSHVEPDAMRFCFDSVMKGSIGEAALLEIVTTEGVGFCSLCGKQSTIQHIYDPCQHCDSFGLTITEGDRVRIKSLEVH